MAQTIEDVNSRTLLQQFHELYNKQNETETDVENLDTKIDQETIDRQTADLSINSQIQALRDQIESLGVLFTYKGEVATIQDLPVTDNKPGDVYYVDSEQSGYVWLEKSGVYQWEEFGPAIDLSEYAKQEDLEQLEDEVTAMGTQVGNNTTNIASLTNTKQDKLTAGTNITIDANNVISASGGLTEVTASDVNSEQATLGQVLTADGNGEASWKNASGGDKLYRHKIKLWISNAYYYGEFICNIQNTFTTDTFKSFLLSQGYDRSTNRLQFTYVYEFEDGQSYFRTAVNSYNNNGTLTSASYTWNTTLDNGVIKYIVSSAVTSSSVSADTVTEL